ncbi:RHS repeat-associated core domain-containing protein, partial [Chryseobacterium aquaticum]
YYPFGMNIPREEKAIVGLASLYNYKYNGKELQETGMYDYGARFYMPDIGRWGVVDELSEKSRRFSTYTYALDNPIMFIDPDGREAEQCCKKQLSWLNEYRKGAWSTAGNILKSAATGTYTSVTGGIREVGKVYNAYQKGGASAAVNQYGKSVYETSGAKGLVETGKKALTGDPRAIGSLGTMGAAAIITHKIGGSKGAAAAETETASVSKTVTVTQESVTQALQDSNLQTAQGVVSGPMVERYVQMAQDGSVAPPIKVTPNGVIVDGNHRYVAGKLTGNEPAQVPGTLSPSQQSKVQPVQNTKVDPNDWGGH